MCGITGGYGSLSSETLADMVESISHRGPDFCSVESIGDVHLGHSRLSIIDISTNSNQPLWNTAKTACIVFNGEIYNYKTLRKELVDLGYSFNSNGDAEVLLNLYLEFGYLMFQKLNGIFSFAIWDCFNESLLIARDPYGVKPLYYTENEDGFFFASEIKALLQLPSLVTNIDTASLYRTLVYLWSPGESTLLSDVKKLLPGGVALVKNRKLTKLEKYSSWPKYDPSDKPANEIASDVLECLRASVADQLVSDVPLGAFLSGGLDSSILVALAKSSGANLECFTIDTGSNNDEIVDDLPYAQAVAKDLAVQLNVLEVKPDIVKLLPKMIYHLDEVQADIAPLSVLLICEHARSKGIKVLLSGAGGDDLFSGYRRHTALKFEKYWSWLPLPFRKTLKHSSQWLNGKSTLGRRLAKAFKYADLEGDKRLLSYFFWMDPQIALSLFVDDLAKDLNGAEFDPMLSRISDNSQLNPLEKMLSIEREFFLVDHNFNYTDKMSMAAGVEVRVPFLDARVAAAASQSPTEMKLKGNVGKWILKRAAEGWLPNDVIYRPKSGFGAPLREWLKGDLASLVDELLSEEKIMNRGIFKPERVRQLVIDDREGKNDYSYSIFALLCFEIWCVQFIDSRSTN